MSVVVTGVRPRIERPPTRREVDTREFTVCPREHATLVPLSYQQAMWWESERRGTAGYRLVGNNALVSPTYGGLRLRGELDTTALQQAVDEVQRRHAALRTRFEIVDGHPWQTFVASS